MNHHSHNIYSSPIPVTCQSDRNDIHPPRSLEQGNLNRETRIVHYVQTLNNGSIGVIAYCEQCCPICTARFVITKIEGSTITLARESGPDLKDGSRV